MMAKKMQIALNDNFVFFSILFFFFYQLMAFLPICSEVSSKSRLWVFSGWLYFSYEIQNLLINDLNTFFCRTDLDFLWLVPFWPPHLTPGNKMKFEKLCSLKVPSLPPELGIWGLVIAKCMVKEQDWEVIGKGDLQHPENSHVSILQRNEDEAPHKWAVLHKHFK